MYNHDYIAIATLNQYSYCAHRCWRMYCAGEFAENQYTVEGTSLHERVHTLGDGMREEIWQIRAIWLKSEEYKLIGKSDLIEAEDGEFYPVEYKRGHRGEWDNDELQVGAQALCLEEMIGKPVTTGYIYYAQSRQRVLVQITEELRQSVKETIASVNELLTTDKIPQAVYSARCKNCSLFKQCLPQATDKVNRYMANG